jgi:hypothetical protein
LNIQTDTHTFAFIYKKDRLWILIIVIVTNRYTTRYWDKMKLIFARVTQVKRKQV